MQYVNVNHQAPKHKFQINSNNQYYKSRTGFFKNDNAIVWLLVLGA
jgi:hypothetical protein